MFLDFLIGVFGGNEQKEALIWKNQSYSYGWLKKKYQQWLQLLDRKNVAPGTVVAFEADFSPGQLALFLALVEKACVLVPISSASGRQKEQFIATAQVEYEITGGSADNLELTATGRSADHSLYGKLRSSGHPGLVLFTSGSTGQSKAAVHDFLPLLSKFTKKRRTLRTVAFLLYDHIGGINTMLYTVSNGGCLIALENRNPDYVLEMVERHGAQLLPTSPTFINLILLSESYKQHNLSSLRLITYGTEPMPQSTLGKIREVLPHVELSQTYGLTEVGILRSKSRSADSLWVKVGGEDFETKVEDGVLLIKARSSMLGYLNAESPFNKDGWLNTGDLVEQDGEYIRFLGRESEIINVGGEKVFPAEVESVLLELDNVAEALVYGEKNPITGNIVCARVRLNSAEPRREFARRLKQFCGSRLDRYKIPVRVVLTDNRQYTSRFKKDRQQAC